MGRPKLSSLECTICRETFKKKQLLVEHMKNHLDMEIEPDDDEENFDNHQKENVKSTQKKILKVKMSKPKCTICGMECSGPKGLKIHMSAHKRHSLVSAAFEKEAEDADMKIETAEEHVDRHQKAKNLSSLECTICHEKFKKKHLLAEHMKNHLDMEIKPDDDEENFDYHQKEENVKSTQKKILKVKMPKPKCTICGMECSGPKGLKIHMSAHKRRGSVSDAFEKEIEDTDMKIEPAEKHVDRYQKAKNLSSLECTICHEKFKKKHLLDEHMQNHLDMEIKPEDDEENFDNHQKDKNVKSTQKKTLKVKMQKLKCTVCGMECKGRKGWKIHMSAHRRRSSVSYTSDNENNSDNNLSQSDDLNTNNNPPVNLSNNKDVNCAETVQPNRSLNTSQFQNQPNIFSYFGNNYHYTLIPNESVEISASRYTSSASAPNQLIELSDSIPKFDYNSEKYLEWLKKFVSYSKMQKIPLNYNFCKKVADVSWEILNGITDSSSSIKESGNFFYIKSMYESLADIKLKHMQHVCS